MIAEEILQDCAAILDQRGQQYGDPAPLYRATAGLLENYTGREFTPADACIALALIKIGRLSQGVDNPATLKDTFIDAINYIALAWEVSQE